MSEPKFNNVPNERIKVYYQCNNGIATNLDFWISRAPAVVGVVFFIDLLGHTYVLLTQRSNKMRDEASKWGVPCGFLDWNETGYDGMCREVHEETSLNLWDFEKYRVFNNDKHPFEVRDNPTTDKHQNVSLLYVSVYNIGNDMQLFPLDIEKFVCHETAQVKWVDYFDFITKQKNYEWAFNHNETIMRAMNFYSASINYE